MKREAHPFAVIKKVNGIVDSGLVYAASAEGLEDLAGAEEPGEHTSWE